jgi:hypothetical protein
VCRDCCGSAVLIDGHLDGNPRQQLIKQDNPHRPSFGVAFAFPFYEYPYRHPYDVEKEAG